MTRHIRIITPHVTPVPSKLGEVEDLTGVASLRFSQVNIASGPVSIESAFDDALCAAGVVACVVQAEADGADAVIIDCFGDPALRAAREAVAIPVIGPGETCMHVAALLGQRFSVVTVLDSVVPILEEHARLYGVLDRLASVRVVQTPVRDLGDDIDGLIARLTDEADRAVREDRAHAVILGCTGFLGVSAALKVNLRRRGLEVPVINPLRTSVMMALLMLQLELGHSPLTYPAPRRR